MNQLCKNVLDLCKSKGWKMITEDTFFYELVQKEFGPAMDLIKEAKLSKEEVLSSIESFQGLVPPFISVDDEEKEIFSSKVKEYFNGKFKNIEKDVLLSVLFDKNMYTHNLFKELTKTKNLDKDENSSTKLKVDEIEFSNKFYPVRQDDIPCIGRDKEIEKAIQTLSRKTKSNPILVGEPGVGKTALVKGLAKRIEDGNVPECLKDKIIFELNVPAIIAGCSMRGEFEEKVQDILDTLIKNTKGKPIIFIDEIHNIIGAGNAGSGQGYDFANLIKPMLADGSLSVIGATTSDEYDKIFKKDKALDRRFNKITVEEPSIDDSCKIIKGIINGFEEYHGVKYGNVIKDAVELSARYITDKYLPDKAIDILDQAGARVKILGKNKVKKEDVASVIAEKTGIPVGNIENDEKIKLQSLEKKLKAKIFGQDNACEKVAREIQVGRVFDGESPISLFFVGPTGTGKTELAKQTAEILNYNLIRIDCGEYQEKTAVAKLLGSAPGYVGYEEGGKLITQIQKNPYSLIIFDEIEKAHPDIYNALLQMLDYGVMTDGRGRKGDFKNTIVIFTSNCGAADMGKNIIGFSSTKDNQTGSEVMTQEMQKHFAPEFLNRLSGVITFNKVDDVALLIIDKELKGLAAELNKKGIKITFDSSVIDEISKTGINVKTGARLVKRVVQDKLKPLLAHEIISGKIEKNIEVYAEEGNYKLKKGA